MQRLAVTLLVALTLLAGSLASDAQPKIPRIGSLSVAAKTSPQAAFRAAFVSGLRERGYVEGQNVLIEHRFAEGSVAALGGLAAELVRSGVDVLLGEGIQASLALKQATSSISTVTLSCDAVAAGLVSSLARPGGNITGVTCITPELAAKRLQLLKEITPAITHVGILWNATDPAKASELAAAQEAGAALSIRVDSFGVRMPTDFDKAFAEMRRRGAEALFALADSFMILHRTSIVSLAATHRLPAMYSFREFVEAGGLVSYGPNAPEMFRRLASYVDKILKGAKPADLPVEQPTKFELVINLRTAKALGLTIPPSVLVRADEVIQ